MKRASLFLSALILGADQIVKQFIRRCAEGVTLFEISGLVRIVRRTNTGAAFSLFADKAWLVALASAALLAALVAACALKKDFTLPARMALAALIAGGAGNLLDRLLFGSVTDYIELTFVRFPVFNLADIAVTCAAGTLLLLLLADKLETKG